MLPVTNSMSSSDQMSTNVSISMNATMPLIDAMTIPPVVISLVATHVNATLVSLVMDSNVLILMNAMITHEMLLQLVPTALVHSAAHAIMVSREMDLTALILMNVRLIPITAMTMPPVKTKSDESLAGATTDILVIELTAMMSTNVTLVLMNVTMMPLVLTI